jgi:hypothetical protein
MMVLEQGKDNKTGRVLTIPMFKSGRAQLMPTQTAGMKLGIS